MLLEGRVVGAYKSGRYWLIPLHNGMPIIIKAKRGQAGTWKTSKKPQKLIVHINSNLIKQNMKKIPEERKPVIAIKGAQKSYVHQLEIPAPCRVVYSPDKPLRCGAKVWIEVLGVHLDLMAS
ncbi:MAG: DNA-binding protein [Pleurocapsa sp.]